MAGAGHGAAVLSLGTDGEAAANGEPDATTTGLLAQAVARSNSDTDVVRNVGRRVSISTS